MNRWPILLIRLRWIFALVWAGLVVGAVSLLPDLNFRFNLGQMLRGDDDQVKEVRQFYKTFPPSDGHLMVTASSSRKLTIDDLRSAERWAEQFRALPEVKEVISPRLLLNLKLDGFTLDEWARLGGTGQEPLEFGDGPGMTTFRGHLVSRNGKSIALYLIRDRGNFYRAVESVNTVPWPDAEVRLVGPNYLLNQMGDLLRANFRWLLSIECLAILIVVPLFMRSLRRAYLPFAVAFSALVFYLALFVLTGQKFGVMHLAGPGLILVIGLADAIHLLQKFDEARAIGRDVVESLRIMFRSVGRACVLTTLTTACGFLSLLFARHEEIYDFGLWCTIGVLTAFATVMLFLPVALVFFPGKGTRVRHSLPLIQPRVLQRLAVPVTVGLVILVAGIHRTRLDSSLEQELPESSPVVQNARWFAEHFRGLDRVEVDLRADLRDPEVVAVVERMQNDLREFPGISGSRSYIDAMRMTLAPEVIDTDDGPMLGAAALSSGGAFPNHLLTRDFDRACIVFYRTRDFGTDRYEVFRDRVRDYAKELPDGGTMKLNGSIPMFYESTTMISKTMILSLVCSFSMITLILMIVLRSVKLGLICLVPNAIPLLVVAGVSGWMGESLHLGILIVFSVGLGLAVDDTIHLMVRYQQLQREKPATGRRELMDEAIVTTGFAIVLTSVVLLISAVCFLFASFATMRGVGVTLGIVAITALLADLIVLPWLMEKFYRRPTASLPSPS